MQKAEIRQKEEGTARWPVANMLAMCEDLHLDPWCPQKRLHVVVWACSLSTGEAETGESWRLVLDSHLAETVNSILSAKSGGRYQCCPLASIHKWH